MKCSTKDAIKNSMPFFSSEGMTNQLLGVVDNNSISSSSNQISSLNLSKNENIRRKISQTERHTNNKIIIVFNIVGIALSVICLIYENLLNNQFQKYSYLYQVTFNFNQYLLGNLINFYTLLPTFDSKDPHTVLSSIKEYFTENNLPSLYDYVYYDLYESLELFPSKYLQFKTAIVETNIGELNELLNTNISVLHFSYVDGNFESSYFTNEIFNYCIMYFVNKLISTVFTRDFTEETIYPISFDDNFFPKFINVNGYQIESISLTQTYIYEIMRGFLVYTNYFYDLQLSLEDLIGNQISLNRRTLNFFIFGIIGVNACIYLMCSIFFRNFNQLILKKANFCIYYLSIQDNITSLSRKLNIIKELSRFYYKSPVKLINQLSNKNNSKKYDRTYTETENNKDDIHYQETQIKKFDIQCGNML